MNEAAIIRYITETCAGIEVQTASGGVFFFNDPEKKFAFATLSINDEYDQFSNLSRPGIFRLNIGVSKQTFQSLFPSEETHDFTALDTFMPHPVYGKMYWVSVLKPDESTFEKVRTLLSEAYATDKAKHEKRASQSG